MNRINHRSLQAAALLKMYRSWLLLQFVHAYGNSGLRCLGCGSLSLRESQRQGDETKYNLVIANTTMPKLTQRFTKNKTSHVLD